MPATKHKSKGPGRNPRTGAFERCVSAVAAKGRVSSPRGVCAVAGRQKYGKKKFQAMAKAGRKNAPKVDYVINRLPDGRYELRSGNSGMFGSFSSRIGIFKTHRGAESARKKHYTNWKLDHRGNAGRKPGANRKKNRGVKKNPLVEAKAAFRDFHGREPEKILVIKEKVHAHTHLSGLGELRQLKILAPAGRYRVTLTFEDGKTILAQNEKRNQLFVRGGDQSVDLTAFGLDKPYHENEVLGQLLRVDYFTTKDHLRPEDGGTAVYRHTFRGSSRFISFGKKRKPTVLYNTVDKLLDIAGGGYTIPKEGIDG